MSYGKPRVSIGMPVYNSERFLPETLDSLVSQTFEDFELIISDNASTDRTAEICRTYAAQDRRIRYLRNETNIGVYKNFNRVFLASSGEYFKWACADDVCHRDLVARCLEVLENDPHIVLVYAKARFIDEAGKSLERADPGWNLQSDAAVERLRYVIYARHVINAFSGLMRTTELAKTRLFPAYKIGDYLLLGDLSLRGKFFEIPEYLFFRRIHQDASGQTPNGEWQKEYLPEQYGHPGLPSWRICFDYLTIVMRSQLAMSQKLSLIGSILYRMRLERPHLLGELATFSKSYIPHWRFRTSRSSL